MTLKYKRILLKLSGEALIGKKNFGIDFDFLQQIINEVKQVYQSGVQIGLVVGGGNFFRGAQADEKTMDRVTGDQIGMLATVMNSIAVQSMLEKNEIPVRVMSAVAMNPIAEPFIRKRAVKHLEKKRVVIFAAGTGNPYFTTDTAAALRASEIDAEIMFKATKVNGVYTKDPVIYPDASFYEKITYDEMEKKNIKVIDINAVSLCKENNIPLIIFNLLEKGNILKAVYGERIGTYISK